MSESVPSSVTGFAHRRARADSIASFTYFQENDESPDWSEDQAIADDEDEGLMGKSSDNLSEYDLESGPISPHRRKSSGSSGSAIEHPLLHRYDSAKTSASMHGRTTRSNQKIYVMAEDLTIVLAGFSTNWLGFVLYVTLCICSGGLLFLIFRWVPNWRVKVIGTAKSLCECEWVVIEVSSSNRHQISTKQLNETRTNGVSLKFRTLREPFMAIPFQLSLVHKKNEASHTSTTRTRTPS